VIRAARVRPVLPSRLGFAPDRIDLTREFAVSDLFAWPAVLGPLLRREDLSEAQAGAAMGSVLAGEATPAQIAAFATGLRIKGETAEEMTGLVKAMLAAAAPLAVPGPLLDTCGTGGDRAGTFNVSTLAALVAAGAGQRVAKHGNRAASGRCGSADLLEALGVVIALPPEGVAATLAEVGIGFCFAPVFHPAMRHAGGPRRELGVPTVFNFLGPLANPARARHQALGVADPRMAPIMAEVLRRTGVHHALVFYGHDGLDELTTTTTSTLLDVSADGVRELEVDPVELDLAPARREDLLGGDVDRNVAIAKEILAGQGGPARDMVLLNAAAALVAADAALSLADGLEAAAGSIDQGRARDTLDAWVESSRQAAAGA
jgi:anthranilate phosphoribosyltransferase